MLRLRARRSSSPKATSRWSASSPYRRANSNSASYRQAPSARAPISSRQWTKRSLPSGRETPDGAPFGHPRLGLVANRRQPHIRPRPPGDDRGGNSFGERDILLRDRAESSPWQMARDGAARPQTAGPPRQSKRSRRRARACGLFDGWRDGLAASRPVRPIFSCLRAAAKNPDRVGRRGLRRDRPPDLVRWGLATLGPRHPFSPQAIRRIAASSARRISPARSEEHTSELQSPLN